LLIASHYIVPSPYQNHSTLHGLFLNPKDGGSRLLWSIGIYLQAYVVVLYMQEDSDFRSVHCFSNIDVSIILLNVTVKWLVFQLHVWKILNRKPEASYLHWNISSFLSVLANASIKCQISLSLYLATFFPIYTH
jgi:hypothetical protein